MIIWFVSETTNTDEWFEDQEFTSREDAEDFIKEASNERPESEFNFGIKAIKFRTI